MTYADRELVLCDLRALASSPLWDRPMTMDDAFRRIAMCRAEAIIRGCYVFGVPLFWHNDAPHTILNGETVTLYKQRPHPTEWR